jgi:CheY-like chemotaxis protein
VQAARDVGSDVLKQKSILSIEMKRVSTIRDIMVIDDSAQDCMHLRTLVHLLLGDGVTTTCFSSVARAGSKLRERMPDLLFLDDHVPPVDRIETSLKTLQRFGYAGPVVFMTGALSTARRRELIPLLPLAILDKDDLNSLRLAEILSTFIARQ